MWLLWSWFRKSPKDLQIGEGKREAIQANLKAIDHHQAIILLEIGYVTIP